MHDLFENIVSEKFYYGIFNYNKLSDLFLKWLFLKLLILFKTWDA